MGYLQIGTGIAAEKIAAPDDVIADMLVQWRESTLDGRGGAWFHATPLKKEASDPSGSGESEDASVDRPRGSSVYWVPQSMAVSADFDGDLPDGLLDRLKEVADRYKGAQPER